MRCANATLPRPRAASPATYSKCGVSPRITHPSATIASNRSLAAAASASTGSSKAPGAHVTSTFASAIPPRRRVLGVARSVSEEVAELVPLDVEIGPILIRRRRHDRQPLDDLQSVAFEAYQLHRIVRQHADRRQSEVEQNLRADAVIPQVRLETELLVGRDGVVALILELVRLELVEEADAPPFLIEVHDHSRAHLRDHPHRAVQLPAAIAPGRAEDVARQALRVHPHQHLLLARDVAEYQRDVLRLIHVVAIADDAEFAEWRREAGFSDPMDEPLVLQPVGDELRDRDERETML